MAAICAGVVSVTSSQSLPIRRRYQAPVLYDPLRTLRYQALNPLSSSSRWAYFDSPLLLRPEAGLDFSSGSSTLLRSAW